MRSLSENATRKTISTRDGDNIEYDEFNASVSKELIDEVDQLIARDYGLDVEEFDAIINFDIKFRTSTESVEED